MGTSTGISWTDSTWNPVRGCSVVSAGCENCYAAGVAARFGGKGQPYEGLARFSDKRRLPQWTGEVRLVSEHLADPLRWTKPRRIFVNSMSDLFHEKLSNGEIASVFGIMAASPRHTFQVLTKRPARMREFIAWLEKSPKGLAGMPYAPDYAAQAIAYRALKLLGREKLFPLHKVKGTVKEYPWPLPNVHLGVSVENQAAADERIPILLDTPSAVRFVSAEPLLERVDLANWLKAIDYPDDDDWNSHAASNFYRSFGYPPNRKLDWIIVGGESGARARPFDRAWAHSLLAQCKHHAVPIFVKQLGAKAYAEVGGFRTYFRFDDRAGADPSEWPEDLRVQQFPKVVA